MTDAPSETCAVALQPSAGGTLTPMELLNTALQRGVDVPTLQALMELQERWETREARKAFDEAMAAARAEMPIIVKSREVDFTTAKGRTNYRYEDLAGVAAAVNPVLAKHGLSYRFRTASPPNEPITVTCIVSHRLGYSEENTLCAGRDETGNKNSIQAIGSTLTYLQRMTLKAALGLASAVDDDAKAAETGGPITDEQLTTLRAALDDVNGDVAKFCEMMGIDNLGALEQSRFNEAMAAVNMKRKRQPKPEAAE